jgi:hypothetical protein
MFHTGRRPMGRLCYWAPIFALGAILAWTVPLCAASPASGSLALTTVTDTVYLADGTPAQGSLILTWPAFVTSAGTVADAGNTTVKLGADGSLSVALVPNVGANPAGVYHTVVYQLGPGEVRTEYWLVPASSPTNLATVRTSPGSGMVAQPVSMQYLNTALAAKADDSSVVHLNGSETISGVKVFCGSTERPGSEKQRRCGE